MSDERNEQTATQDLVDRWIRDTQHVESCKRELSQAECAAKNSTNALGKRIAPDDMKEGEEIYFRLMRAHRRERLLVVKRNKMGDYAVSFRGQERDA